MTRLIVGDMTRPIVGVFPSALAPQMDRLILLNQSGASECNRIGFVTPSERLVSVESPSEAFTRRPTPMGTVAVIMMLFSLSTTSELPWPATHTSMIRPGATEAPRQLPSSPLVGERPFPWRIVGNSLSRAGARVSTQV